MEALAPRGLAPHRHGHGGHGHDAHDAQRGSDGGVFGGRDPDEFTFPDDEVIASERPRLPPAAAHAPAARPAVGNLFLLTLLSAIDGSLVALAAAGHLDSLANAAIIGLVVVAGAGSWLAAQQAFGNRRRTHADWLLLGVLGIATAVSTVAAVWLGVRLGDAVTLHILPKGAGLVLFLVSAEVAGLRLPRAGRVPLPIAGLLGVGVLEVLAQWAA